MIKEIKDKNLKEEKLDEFNNLCEECKKEDESVFTKLDFNRF